MREMLMWTCSRGATNSICSCDECSVNSRMLLVWSWYFKEKYIRNAGLSLTRQTSNKLFFSIRSGSPQSRMPRLHPHTDVDIPLYLAIPHVILSVLPENANLYFLTKFFPLTRTVCASYENGKLTFGSPSRT